MGLLVVKRFAAFWTREEDNAERPAALFSDQFAAILRQAHCGLRHKVAEAVYLIDSSGVKLNGLSDWAQLSNFAGAKLHVILTAVLSAIGPRSAARMAS